MEFRNNKKDFRFEAVLPDGEYATLGYRWLRGNMVLMQTLVPPSARGKGIGSELVKYVLDYVTEQGLKIIIYCPFVEKYLETHIEYAGLVVPRPTR
jgi:uncharacterized protein